MGDFVVFLLFALLFFLLDKADNKRKPVPKRSGQPQPRAQQPPETQRQRETRDSAPQQPVELPPAPPAPWPEQQRQQPEVKTEPQIVWDIPAPADPAEGRVYREAGTAVQNMQEAAEAAAADAMHTAAYETARAAEEAAIRAQEEAEYLRQAKLPGTQAERQPLTLTPATAMQAMALSVVLAPPRARVPRRYGHIGVTPQRR